jgi:hypothetical protein
MTSNAIKSIAWPLTTEWSVDRWGCKIPPGSWPVCPVCGTSHHPADHE